MSQANPQNRRWFQFGLGTLLLIVAAFAAVLAYHVNWIRQRNQFLAKERAIGAAECRRSFLFDDPYFIVRALGVLWAFRERGYKALPVYVDVLKDELRQEHWERLRRAKQLFPEAEIVAAHCVVDDNGVTTATLSEPFSE